MDGLVRITLIFTGVFMFICGVHGADFVKNVHVIYMNHLDVGYDGIPKIGFINNVLNKYFTEYFPRAANLGKQLKDGGYVETFKYTTHPWLVSMYLDCPPNLVLAGVKLQCPNATQIATFNTAVKAGYITWHAGTMNIQSENNLPWLYEFGLQLADDLDKRFGIKRMAKVISQRDVPGMTQAVIPSLAKYNVLGVSVGVNQGTAPPDVPQIFRWRYGGHEVIGTWHKGGYPGNPGPEPKYPGGISRKDCVIIPNYPDVLCYAFRTDNSGPPMSYQEILGYFEILRAEYPNAMIKASTFEEYFLGVKNIQNQLPVITNEIGDNWIQGIASDPRKLSEFRAVGRVMGQCFMQGKCSSNDTRVYNASRILLKLPEHTWGLASVGDISNWTNTNFHRVMNGANFVNCSKSWIEQRQFTYLAVDALQNHSVVKDIKAELAKLTPVRPDLTDFMQLAPVQWQKSFQCDSNTMIGFGMDGSIQLLSYKGVKYATSAYPMALFMYNTYNKTDTDNLDRQYSYIGGPGFAKPNVTLGAHPESRSWPVSLRDMYMRNDGSCDFYLHIQMTDITTWKYYGAPQDIWIKHSVRKGDAKPGIDTTFQWYDKTSTRLPESLMLSFMSIPTPGMKWFLSKLGQRVDPTNVILNGSQYQHGVDTLFQWFDKTSTRLPESLMLAYTTSPMMNYNWTMSKLGQKVDPHNVLLNGSQYQHAVDDDGFYYTSTGGSGLHIYSLDVPLVGPMTASRKAPPSYPCPLKPITEQIVGMAYNFYNNVWDTNYIQWYPFVNEDKDMAARFSIEFV